MIFYKFTCSNQQKEVLADKEVATEIKKQDLYAYKKFFEEKQDDDFFLFIVRDEENRLEFDVIFKKSLDKIDMVDKIVHEFIKYLNKSFDQTIRKEISIDTLISDINTAQDDNFIENAYEIKSIYDIDYGPRRCFKEYLINKGVYTQEEMLDICNKQVLNQQFVEEIKRIYMPKKTNAFGVPVHYILNMQKQAGQNAVRILIDALHSNGRMLRDKYSVLYPSMLCRSGVDLFLEISSIFKMNDGGVVVISSGAEIDETDYYSREQEVLKAICQVCNVAHREITFIFQLHSLKNGQLNYIKNNLPNLSFVEVQDTALCDEMAEKFLKKLACRYSIQETQSLLNLVEPQKAYKAFELEDIFKDWQKKYLQTIQFPQYSMFVKEERKVEKEVSENDGYKELSSLIGQENIKKIVTDFINYAKLNEACKGENMKGMQFSRHMCFVGNPGTAKTTVARIIAKIMKEENLLSGGRLIEVGRADIVSRFVGGTAPKVKELFKQAIGNVLFIDEAYSLCDGRDGLFGDEAINTIVQEMENNRENLVVIFAGYKNEMQKFLDRNSGLRSRIAFEVEFPDYSEEELIKIAEYQAKKMDVDISQCEEKLREIIALKKGEKNFGNGRFVRNILEKARMKQATRLVNENLLHTSKMRVLLPEDIDMPVKKIDKFSFGFHC